MEGEWDEWDEKDALYAEEEEQGDEVIKGFQGTKKNPIKINNVRALKQKYESIKLVETLPWIETMAVTYDKDHIGVDENHDLKRELAFYEQAKYACKVGSEKLLELGVPLVRPKDYFAEMVKTDEHMEHIRSRLAKQKVRLQMIEQKKRNNEQRKFGKGKQMQARLEKEKEKAAQGSEARSLQKKRKQYGGASDVDNNQDDDDEGPKKKSRKELPESVQYGKQGRTNYKRVHKDAKFGKGSRKKGGWKQNDADSNYTSRDDFNPRQNRAPFGSKAGKRSQGGGKKPSSSKNRPGKERRLKKTLGKK